MKKQIKPLFVQDLAQVQGGQQTQPKQNAQGCPEITTLACGEEPPHCIGC